MGNNTNNNNNNNNNHHHHYHHHCLIEETTNQTESQQIKYWFLLRGENCSTLGKTSPHMITGQEIEAGQYWWETSALTSAPTLLMAYRPTLTQNTLCLVLGNSEFRVTRNFHKTRSAIIVFFSLQSDPAHIF